MVKIAVLGNHTPRQCGIATFTADLSEALGTGCPDVECFVLAMNDAGKRHAYPPRVRFEIAEGDLGAYRRAADFLNVNAVDILNVQHEYGIFGGKSGSHVLELLRDVRMPIVTTLHTILATPNSSQRAVLDELTQLSERLIVMSAHGAKLLRETHGVPDEKIDLIPHGIPEVGPDRRSKDRLGVEGKWVILTFGLLSPDKGIENVIDALPEIVAQYPDTVYVVLGATHPHVREQQGEFYRVMLEARAQALGVDSNVIFHDRFVSREELIEFLSAADIYITPYLKAEQITSGTLAYAVGSGKAVISTPYLYAQELLAEGRGILVPWRDSTAIAKEVIDLLGNDAKRVALCERAAAHGKEMLWPIVAGRYVASFEHAQSDHRGRLRAAFQAKSLAKRPTELPQLNLEHLRRITDSTGVLQHCAFNIPRYEDGYCLDDNARALLLMALIVDAGTDDSESNSAYASRYLAFVNHSFDPTIGRFRNFMSYGRQWLEDRGSEDSHGRATWALGAVVGRSRDPGQQSLAGQLFQRALPTLAEFSSPRAWAFGLLGIDEYHHAFEGDSSVQAVRTQLVDLLFGLFQRNCADDWPWFEDRVTYSNARLSQALIVSGVGMGRDDVLKAGLLSLSWLARIQRTEEGYFAPIGSNGFLERGHEPASFDQQPVEACAMVSACLAAARATDDVQWVGHARRVFRWFLGQNQIQKSLYDPRTGGCRDGLHSDRVNENQGAESTLSFLLALQEMRLEMRSVERTGAAASSPSRAQKQEASS